MLGVAMSLGLDTVTTRNTILALLPIGAMSWFAQTFLVLYILTPVINCLLHWLQNRYYLILMATSTVIWFIILTAINLWANLPDTTFGIYLLHDNKLVMHYMWDHIFSTYQYYDSPLLLIYAVLIVAFIFIIGMCVDYLWLAFIEKPVMKRITSYIESSQLWVAQKVPF